MKDISKNIAVINTSKKNVPEINEHSSEKNQNSNNQLIFRKVSELYSHLNDLNEKLKELSDDLERLETEVENLNDKVEPENTVII